MVIPLWDWRLDSATAEAEWQQQVPGWAGMRVAHSGTYLGYEIGPAAAAKSSQGPVTKFKEAVLAWAGGAEGLHLTTLAYNIYIIPKLSHVAQLHGQQNDWQVWCVFFSEREPCRSPEQYGANTRPMTASSGFR